MTEERTKILVVGAGEVGLGALEAIIQRHAWDVDVEPVGLVTRRPVEVKKILYQRNIRNIPVLDQNESKRGGLPGSEIDVAILADASQVLLDSGPEWLNYFNTVDSTDFHDKFGPYTDKSGKLRVGYFYEMQDAAIGKGRLAGIGFGWDPGNIFSSMKIRGKSIFPNSVTNVFYGPGKSQGHTTALKTDDMKSLGVIDAIQFTMPNEDVMKRVQSGEMREFSAGERMWRNCYLLVKPGSDTTKIEEKIRTMPGYFADYNRVDINFVDEGALKELQKRKNHQGTIIITGKTRSSKSVVEQFTCTYENNADATGAFLVSAAKGIHKLYLSGERGAVVAGDMSEYLTSPFSRQEIIKRGL